VTDWCPPRRGGIEGQVAGLGRALAARGHTVHLFTTTRHPCAIPGVHVHAIETPMVGDVAAPALWKVPELRAMLVDCGLDVVHAHGMFSTLAIGSLLAAHGARLPSVTTHHSLLRQSLTLPAAWLTYRLFSRRATIVTAVSRAAAEDARRVSGRTDVEILPNGLDRAMWRTGDARNDGSACPERSRRARVVSVMRLAAKKSPGDLIDAVPVVLAGANHDVVFSIVGDGPERAGLEERARRLGVASHVEFLGACDPARVAGVLARSTLFALPSAREAFGIAILEARAAGLPIVARASGGIPEIVQHGRQGMLVDTPQALGGAIATLINDDTLRQQYALASADGLDPYDWDRVVDRHETVYRRAIAALRGKG
jgi:glycosyltransferase involved in cell wall biosynthesis